MVEEEVVKGFGRSIVLLDGGSEDCKKALLFEVRLPNGLLGFLWIGWLGSGWPDEGTAWLAVTVCEGCPKPELG